MTDNTQLNVGANGDFVRTIAKTANSPAKTQAVILDVGGGSDSSSELALAVGQKTAANSLSFVPASDALAEPGGAPITGATMPTGGLGITGWLSAIWKALTGTINVSTVSSNPSSVYANEIAPGITASQLPSQALVNGVVITALSSNTATIFVGGSSAVTNLPGLYPRYPLAKGQSISVAATNLNAVWLIANNTADAVAILGN